LLFVVAGFLFFLPIIFCLLLLEHNRYILW
jgi:hypothetical protein